MEDYSYLSKIVNCTVQIPPYYILPSGVLATHTGTGILTPHYFDRANDSDGFPRGSLVGFNIDSEQYISMFTRLGRGEFIGFCKSKDFEAVKTSTDKDYPSLTDCEKIIYNGFSPMAAGTYNVTIPITRDGTVQTYTFSYVNRPATKIDGVMPGNVIPQGMYASCDFCEEYKNSPGRRYYDSERGIIPDTDVEALQQLCEKAKAFNRVAGEVAKQTLDFAYWDDFMKGVYGQTLTLTANQTHAQYVAGLYEFANWYNKVKASLNTINQQKIMALSIMWLPDEVIRRLDCDTRKNIIDVLLSDALTGKTLFTNVDRRGALMKLFGLSEKDGVCILKYLLEEKYTELQIYLDQTFGLLLSSEVGQQDAIALAILGLPSSVIKGIDCVIRKALIDKLMSKNLKGEDFFTSATRGSDRAAFIKLLESSGDKEQAKCVYDKIAGDCTKLQTLLNSFGRDQAHFSQFASAFKSISAIAMSSWSTEKIQDNFKGEIMHVGYLGYRCPSDPYIKLDVTITGCQVNVKYSMPNGFKIVPIGGTDGVTSECFEPIEWSKTFDLFELIVVIPTGNVREFGWNAGESHVVPAYMLAYLSKKQDNEIKEAASKVGFTVLNIAFVLGTLGEGAVLELGAIQATTRSLAVMAASGEITTVLAEKQIRELFKDPAAAQDFINTLHEISLFFLSADALVSVASAIRNVEK